MNPVRNYKLEESFLIKYILLKRVRICNRKDF